MSLDSTGKPENFLPYPQYIAGLPRKVVASSMLLRNTRNEILLAERSYTQYWDLPGGTVESGETPWAAASRELREELGWQRTPQRLILIDHAVKEDPFLEIILFVFDGGIIDEHDLTTVVFADKEIVNIKFCHLLEVHRLMRPGRGQRIASALAAIEKNTVVLCENGRDATNSGDNPGPAVARLQ